MPIGTVSKMKYDTAPVAQLGTAVHSGLMRTAIIENTSGENANMGARHIRTRAVLLPLSFSGIILTSYLIGNSSSHKFNIPVIPMRD